MPKNEDGEFELVLGNTQLLSVFFIVVALMGVFFAIGYILGRNSSPLASETASTRKTTKPLVVDSPRDTGGDTASTPSTPPASTPPPTVKPTPKTEPEEQPRPEKAKPAEPEKVAKAEPAKAKPAEPKPTPAPAAGELSGTYLQLTATNEHEATVYVDVLRKKGFRAQSAEVPDKRGLFRVLVGPIGEANLNKTKSDLKAAGFPGDQAIKRTF